MINLFDDLKQGLEEAIAFTSGQGEGKVYKYTINPVEKYNASEIKQIRKNAHLTQAMLAEYMGVSIKTIEAWESARSSPTGPACRLLSMLSNNEPVSFAILSAT